MAEQMIRYTAAEQRGRDAYCEIRERINMLRSRGEWPRTVYVNASTGDDMKALWLRACGPEWDEKLPKMIAGVPCVIGSTGGHDFLVELYPREEGEALARMSKWRAVDNPLPGTH